MLEHRFAKVLVFVTFCLLLLGGIVHNTGSSLACPDWPLCYGSALPPMQGKVAVEHSHRLLASTVGCMTIGLAVLLWKRRRGDRPLCLMGLVAVFLVVAQGILGGMTVLYQLPELVSTAHLATSMLFFSLLIVIVWRTSLNPPTPPFSKGGIPGTSPFEKGGLRGISVLPFFTTFFVYLQMILGAFVRHSKSGLVCPDIPFCYGSLWPEGHPMLRLHMAHRILGMIVAAAIIWLSTTFWKKSRGDRRICYLLIAAPLLVLTQVVLGFASVTTRLGVVPVTAHLGVAALLLGVMVSLSLLTDEPSSDSLSDFVALVKPRITALVIFTTAAGFLLAPGKLQIAGLAFVIVGSVLLVGSANALNMYLERDVDALMARTKERPLPSKRMQPKVALSFGIFLAIVAFIILMIGVNHLTLLLGVIAFVSYVLFYTPLKQKSHIALLVGAVPGALPPLMGWTAATDQPSLPGLSLFFILFLWQIPHFLAIALFRKEEYEKAGIRVLPLERGERVTKQWALRYLAGLIAVSFYPFVLGVAGVNYFWTALALGVPFFLLGCYGLRATAGLCWARSFFLVSIIYLPLLLSSLVLFGRL